MGKLPLDKGLAAQADWGFKIDATPTQNPPHFSTKFLPTPKTFISKGKPDLQKNNLCDIIEWVKI
jgi:hypothetical protein